MEVKNMDGPRPDRTTCIYGLSYHDRAYTILLDLLFLPPFTPSLSSMDYYLSLDPL